MRALLASLFVVATLVLASGAHGAAGDSIADRVLGQPDLTHAAAPSPPTASSLWGPQGIAIAPDGRLYVADARNNRVLSWPSASTFTSGQAADLVIGQPNFTSNLPNNGGLGPQGLSGPRGVAVDGAGNLWVADQFNNRVLEYDAPPTHDAAADRVIGQGSFASDTFPAVPTAASLHVPYGIGLDAAGNLYVADVGNNRVLEYDSPLANGDADRVFGQPDFTSDASPGTGPATLSSPLGVTVDTAGNVFISDSDANRVLEYDAPLTHDTVADRVLGQPDLSSGGSGVGPANLTQPAGIAVDPAGNVYVVDSVNNRALGFVLPFDTDAVADVVFGQPDFQSNAAPAAGTAAPTTLGHPTFVAVDAAGTLYVSDFDGNRVLAFDTPLGGQPPLVTQVSATPNPAGVGQAVAFAIAGVRPGGGALAVTWDFGDGSSGNGVTTSHVYTVAGSFTAKASVTDGAGSASGQVAVQVQAPVVGTGFDTDGDGFSDAFEQAWGTSPTDATSAPLPARPTARPLGVGSLRIQLDFTRSGGDRISVGGTFSMPAHVAPAGERVGIDVGGVSHVFTLDARGKSRDAAGVFALGGRGRRAKYRMALASGSFSAPLADAGFRRDVKKARVNVVVSLFFHGEAYQKSEPKAFRVKQQRIGRTR